MDNRAPDTVYGTVAPTGKRAGRTVIACIVTAALVIAAMFVSGVDRLALAATKVLSGLTSYPDPAGVGGTFHLNGGSMSRGAFFEVLGSNGRSCSSCHVPDQGMGISAEKTQARFAASLGKDPLFAPIDGANCPGLKRGDPRSHSLMLNYGLLRVGLQLPANAEFKIQAVHDPYGCAIVVDPRTGTKTISVYRRPLPAANLRFNTTIMWDGRETVVPLDDPTTYAAHLRANLASQALHATTGHAEALSDPKSRKVDQIVAFELGLYTSQLHDRKVGDLMPTSGGPVALSQQKFYPFINDVVNVNQNGEEWTSQVFDRFHRWQAGNTASAARPTPSQADIAEGERLFNTAPGIETTIRGFNDKALGDKGLGAIASASPCSTCHNVPNVGSMSRPLLLDIGLSHTADKRYETDPQVFGARAAIDQPDLPIYLIKGCSNPFWPGQHASFYTSDPGRALITGKCEDLNRFKVPALRGLAGRAPYFHNGSAKTLREVVDFYDKRFLMKLTERQKEQLTAFLNSL